MEEFSHYPNKISTLDAELVLREIPGKFRQGHGQTRSAGLFRSAALGDAPGDEVLRIALSPARLRLRPALALALRPRARPLTRPYSTIRKKPLSTKSTRTLPGSLRHLLASPTSSSSEPALTQHRCRLWARCRVTNDRAWVYRSPAGGSCGSCGKPGVLGGFSKRLVGIAKRFQRPCGRLVWARTATRLGRYFKSSTGPSAAAASTGL